MALGHFVNLQFRKLYISSTCDFVNLSFCQLVILSTCHFVNLSICQIAILSNCHFVKLSFCQLVIQSICHFISLSFCQLAISLTSHFVQAIQNCSQLRIRSLSCQSGGTVVEHSPRHPKVVGSRPPTVACIGTWQIQGVMARLSDIIFSYLFKILM